MKAAISTLAAAVAFSIMTPAQSHGLQGYGFVSAQPGYAVRHHPLEGLREINARQELQRARIEHGFRRGVITRFEYRVLMAEQHEIQALERAFVADGFLSPRERLELHRRLDIASRHIFAEAHDRQRRF